MSEHKDDEFDFISKSINSRGRLDILACNEKASTATAVESGLFRSPTKRAKVISKEQFERALNFVATGNSPVSDELKLMFSYLAGLRAIEIANLTMECVTNSDGAISGSIWIPSSLSKSGRERNILMHPRIKRALVKFRRLYPELDYFAFSNRYNKLKRQSKLCRCLVWRSV